MFLGVCLGMAATVVCVRTPGVQGAGARGAESPQAGVSLEPSADDSRAGEHGAYDSKSGDSKSGDSKSGDSKAYDSKAYDSKSDPLEDAPRGADAAPVAHRDDLGPPDQEQPRHVVAAYIAAADAGEEQRAFALMTPACAERERSWKPSFSTAIFDRGYHFHVVRLQEEQVSEQSAELQLGVVFLDGKGEPDKEGMLFRLVRVEGQWWLDEIR